MVGLGKKLKKLRSEKLLTQAQVASIVGVTKSVISAYETEIRYPSYDILKKLASLFNVSSDYLLGLDNKRGFDINGLTERQIEILSNMIDEYKSLNKL